MDLGRLVYEVSLGDVDCERCGGPGGSGPILLVLPVPESGDAPIPWYLCDSCANSFCNWMERR